MVGSTSETRKATLRMIAAGLLLGTLGIFVAEAGLDSLSATFYRCVLGAVVLALYCAWMGVAFTPPSGWRASALAISSGVLMAGNWVFFFEALSRTGIAVATLAFHVQPILVLLLAAGFLGERFTKRDAGWVSAAFLGLVLTLAEKAAEPAFDTAFSLGIAAALFAALLYAGVTLIARALGDTPPAQLTLIQCVVGAALLAGFGPVAPGAIGLEQWAWLAGMGAIHTGLVYILLYGALPILPTGTIGVLLFVYPASAVGFDFLVYGRTLSGLQGAGLALVLAASWGVTQAARPRRR